MELVYAIMMDPMISLTAGLSIGHITGVLEFCHCVTNDARHFMFLMISCESTAWHCFSHDSYTPLGHQHNGYCLACLFRLEKLLLQGLVLMEGW